MADNTEMTADELFETLDPRPSTRRYAPCGTDVLDGGTSYSGPGYCVAIVVLTLCTAGSRGPELRAHVVPARIYAHLHGTNPRPRTAALYQCAICPYWRSSRPSSSQLTQHAVHSPCG
eukprot:2126055-Rhodomonas_salina.4